MSKETDAEWYARMYATNAKFANVQDLNYKWDNASMNNRIKRGLVVYHSTTPQDKEMIKQLRKDFEERVKNF